MVVTRDDRVVIRDSHCEVVRNLESLPFQLIFILVVCYVRRSYTLNQISSLDRNLIEFIKYLL